MLKSFFIYTRFLFISLIFGGTVISCTPLKMENAEQDIQPPQMTVTSVERTATLTPFPSPAAATMEPVPSPTAEAHPLTIEYLRSREFPGSDILFEETLTPYDLYDRYLTSYRSDGLKIYAYMTIPKGEVPATGWPVIIFNHGYIPPDEYVSTERYIAYMDRLASRGYIVFRPDYRGHGESEGSPSGAYSSPGYTIDVLNALASLKRLPSVDSSRIGMWGHSMGGYITLRSMVVSPDINAGVIWGGVVGTYEDLAYNWRRSTGSQGATPSPRRSWRSDLAQMYGTPQENPEFWNSISANSYLEDLSGPVQLHHGAADETVPVSFSEQLYDQITLAGETVEYYPYPGDNHNISNSFETAMGRSVEFFNVYVKGEPQ